MAHGQFKVSDTNPNDNTGGGGCICDPLKQTDCKPPFVIFTDNFMEDPRSPYVVACQTCINAALEACDGEVLSIGEANPYAVAEPIVDADVVEDEDDEPGI